MNRNELKNRFESALEAVAKKHGICVEGATKFDMNGEWFKHLTSKVPNADVYVHYFEHDEKWLVKGDGLPVRYGLTNDEALSRNDFFKVMKDIVVPALEEGEFNVKFDEDMDVAIKVTLK